MAPKSRRGIAGNTGCGQRRWELDYAAHLDGKVLPGGEVAGDKFTWVKVNLSPALKTRLSAAKRAKIVLCPHRAGKLLAKELRGKKLDFKVKLKAVFELKLPELSDEFAKSLGKLPV